MQKCSDFLLNQDSLPPEELCRWIEFGYAYWNRSREWRIARFSTKTEELKRKTLWHIMQVDDVPYHRCKYKNTGAYTTIFRFSAPDLYRSLLYGGFYMDFDQADLSDENFEKVREDALTAIDYLEGIFHIRPEMMRIFFSGSKGIHLYIPPEVFGVQPHESLNEAYRTLFDRISQHLLFHTADSKVYDRRRLIRLPYSCHEKTNLFKIDLAYEELKSSSLGDICEMAKSFRILPEKSFSVVGRAHEQMKRILARVENMRPRRRMQGPGRVVKIVQESPIPPCIQELMNMETGEGVRNNVCFVLASYFSQRGMDVDNIREVLYGWNDGYVNPPLTQDEIDRVIESVHVHGYAIGFQGIQQFASCKPEDCAICQRKQEESLKKLKDPGAILKRARAYNTAIS